MKSEQPNFDDKTKAEMVRSARIALGGAPDSIGETAFWQEFRERLDQHDAGRKVKIEPRLTRKD